MRGEPSDTDRRRELLAEVVRLAGKAAPGTLREDIAAYLQRYYAQVELADLVERSPQDLAGGAMSLWQFGQRRTPGETRVRVFNPGSAGEGWQSSHTIVEIVNDDMPFLVDSVTMEVNRHGLTQHLIIHPIVTVRRSADGERLGLAPIDGEAAATAAATESMIHAEVDRIIDVAEREALEADLSRVLGDVRAAVDDWQVMVARMLALADEATAAKLPLEPLVVAEGVAFLRWLVAGHFTFLGYRCSDLEVEGDQPMLRVTPGTSVGILRQPQAGSISAASVPLPPAVLEYARRPELVAVTKATTRATVHRAGYLDTISIKRFDALGKVCGEHRFIGLFTSSAYRASPLEIPVIRRKVATVIERAALPPGSAAGKALADVLEAYPRDELFQTTDEDLLRTALAILHLNDRQRFRLFVRRDPFENFVSCLVFVSRDIYTTELRRKWESVLELACNGTASDFEVNLSDWMLARVRIVVRTHTGHIPPLDVVALEARLAAISRRWTDELRVALIVAEGEAPGNASYRQFVDSFPASYRDEVTAQRAVKDIALLRKLAGESRLVLSLFQAGDDPTGRLHLKLLRPAAPIALSDSLPILERMGFRVQDERSFRLQAAEGSPVFLHDFELTIAGPGAGSNLGVDVGAIAPLVEEAFAAIFEGRVENDEFNRLTIVAKMPARDVAVFRAYAKYMRQATFALSPPFVATTLAAHPEIARLLLALFYARFDPDGGADALAREARVRSEIAAALASVADLSEDRALRQLVALIEATTRTNFWRRDASGAHRAVLSFKFDPSKVPGLPEPRPMFEIFVYAARFEGVHLRGGRVARGGLRWSDRREDFRTEVLGLMKAQVVKNVVIVPTGSKGGFVLKRPPPLTDRDAYHAEGVACYMDYLRGLLDLTDNRVGGKVVPPPDVKRHDADDPYLVVAADKGTATFSDYANEVSREYGFWLGDAFASGGSAGYDHKAMAITARGAWESTKRHFRELGVDTQAKDFSVVGIGDMSGDVFGNGMLLSKHIRLLAAFDHRHILLDPAPDPAVSFAERERLFRLPRSSWDDYDRRLVSAGGGVYPRSAKSIEISPEVKAALGIAADALTPAELISALLKSPVDLIYNGGIGTYVKASTESHAEVGDRANDEVRVNGRELHCKVFVEGGNLGCTQRGRIEYARTQGRINTDAIDNSGGVDCSDHEVNIKILLGAAIASGRLTLEQRNAQLAAMTDDVAALVLRDNYFQTQLLSVSGRIAPQLLDEQERFIRYLERDGRLNRALEFLPTDQEFAELRRARQGLTSPERAVLLAYAKIWLEEELLASILPDDPWVASVLQRYFPPALAERYAVEIATHPLRREIVATYVTNSMLNRVGSTFVHRLMEATGAPAAQVVRAYLLAREVFGMVPLWNALDAKDVTVADEDHALILFEVNRLLERGAAWFLRSRRLGDDMAATIACFAPGVDSLARALPALLDNGDRLRIDEELLRLTARGVHPELAARIVVLDALFAALDIIEEANIAERPVETVARVYFALGSKLDLPWLHERITQLPVDGHWQVLARAALEDDLAARQRALARMALAAGRTAPAPRLVASWLEVNGQGIARLGRLVGELRSTAAPDAAMLSVALGELRGLTG